MLLNAILPIFLLIIVGYLLKYFQILDDQFWHGAEKLTYYILFPALLIGKMSVADLSSISIWPTTLSALLGLLLISIMTIAIKPLFSISNASFGAVYQGTMRFNTYIGLALVSNLFGEEGLVIAVIIASILIPAVNVCAVIALQHYHPNKSDTKKLSNTFKSLFKNPLILSCLIGIGLNTLHIAPPIFVMETINIIGSIALPLGLMAVGAAFILSNIKSAAIIIVGTSALKLVIYPIIAFFIAEFFPVNLLTQQVLVIFCALPTATASYVLTKNMAGDHQLMARIITIETLLSAVTLLIILKLFNIS